MAKRIILLSDGTGNSPASVWRSNVWRTFDLLDLSRLEQIALYNDGIGTSSFLPAAWIQAAFGYGLKHNVLDLYKWLCRYHSEEAEIFAFGFSRGAVTIRVLIGLVDSQGLVRYSSESDLNRQARLAYLAYRAERYHSVLRVEALFRALRDRILDLTNGITGRAPYRKENNRRGASFRFVGLWDTVQDWAPFYEMSKGFSLWLWPLELPDRTLPPNVKRARHALALDDERATFHPVLWTEAGEPDSTDEITHIDDERISQVWFAGVHSNVGGGYPDDALAEMPLNWMLTEAGKCGLKFQSRPDGSDPFPLRPFRDGRIYASRSGLASLYRYGPRNIHDLSHAGFSNDPSRAVEIAVPKVHQSALRRIHGANVYAPIGVPAKYAVVIANGQVLKGNANPYESLAHAQARANAQERVWDLVWKRRIVYFCTVWAWWLRSALASMPCPWRVTAACAPDAAVTPVAAPPHAGARGEAESCGCRPERSGSSGAPLAYGTSCPARAAARWGPRCAAERCCVATRLKMQNPARGTSRPGATLQIA
jgi:hypothetical protein